MKTRLISAAVMIPLVIICLIFGGAVFNVLIALVSIISVLEITNALKKAEINTFWVLNLIYSVAASIAVYFGGETWLFRVLILFVLITLPLSFILPKADLRMGAATVFVMVYPTTLLGIFCLAESLSWVYIVAGAASAVITDTAAYFTGKYLGKRKLCPKISPNKTIEGAIGGAVATFVLISVYGILCRVFMTGTIGVAHTVAWLVVALLCGIFAQVGDLFASYIKRICDIKDFSNIIPGHGGVLDRIDSAIFTIAIVYLFASMGII